MIIERNPDYKEVVERNKKINHHRATDSFVPCCGHDFWDDFKKMDYGDVVLCNRCSCYYAKIKHLPWVVESQRFGPPYHTNHLTDGWGVFVGVRITD